MDSLLGLDLSRNYSLLTVPAAFVSLAAPHIYAVHLSGKLYDNANPRRLPEAVTASEVLTKETKARILRAKAASENGFETLGLYAAAVVAANHAGLSARTLNLLTIGYVLSRVGYNVAYVWLGANRNLAIVRSCMWMVGMGLTMTLWIKAGLALGRK